MYTVKLKDISIGEKFPVVYMGVINVSPESYYKESVKTDETSISQQALKYIEEGASIIDIGGQSTAPPSIYGEQVIVSAEEELNRIKRALKAILDQIPEAIVSVDTQRASVAEYALAHGALIINDISGFKKDANMAKTVAEHDAVAILMAAEKEPGDVGEIPAIMKALHTSIKIAETHEIPRDKIILDPGIGSWQGRTHLYDLSILNYLELFLDLKQPLLVSISRKSLIPRTLGEDIPPLARLPGTLAATALAVYKGAHVVRTHDVKESRQACRLIEAIKEAPFLPTL